jgi:hypothetical protein
MRRRLLGRQTAAARSSSDVNCRARTTVVATRIRYWRIVFVLRSVEGG